MPDHATPLDRESRQARHVARAAVAAAALGVFLTWTSDGPVDLDGTQGPNNGWLIAIVSVLALGWLRPMERGSWVGVIGVLGSALVMIWTAAENWLDARAVVGASMSFGLLLVVAAGVALSASAVLRAMELARPRRA